MIDLCPVGALTSKPFRYAARTWELARRKSVSPHDALGSNLVVQVKNDRVMRVLPLENEAVNECWISDKDRFSYEALNGDDRLTAPMIRQGGEWIDVDWQTALEFVADALKDVAGEHGGAALGALVSPHSTLEEMALAARLLRGARLRQRRLPAAADRFPRRRAGRRHSVAGNADRRARRARPRAGRRQLPAQGPPAARAAAAPGGEEGRAGVAAARGRRRLADAGRARARRARRRCCRAALAEIVVAAARGAGQAGAGGAGRHRAVGRARRRSPRASPAASARRSCSATSPSSTPQASQLLRAGAGARRSSPARRSAASPKPRTASAATSPARCRRRAGSTRRRCSRSRAGPTSLLNAEPAFDCANPVAARAALGEADFVVVLSPFRHGTELRRRAAADRPVHRNRRHLRQLRGPRPGASTGS